MVKTVKKGNNKFKRIQNNNLKTRTKTKKLHAEPFLSEEIIDKTLKIKWVANLIEELKYL